MVLVDVVRVAIAGREIRAQLFEVAVGRGDADGVWDNHGGLRRVESEIVR